MVLGKACNESEPGNMLRYQSRWKWIGVLAALGGVTIASVWMARNLLASDPLKSGWRAYAEGNWEKALELARERLKVTRDDTEALRLLARSSIRLGRDSSGMAVYSQVGPNAMTADDLCVLGIALTRSGNNRALEVWEQACAAEPNHAETLFELTRAYARNDRLDKAIKYARRLAECPGWEGQAKALQGAIALARSDPDEALAFWRSVLEQKTSEKEGTNTPVVPPKEFARALLQTRQPTEARHHLEDALRSDIDPETFWLLSRAYLQEGDYSKAVAVSEKGGPFRADNPLVPEPSPFAGASRCAECHSAIFQAQQSSRHAHTFFRSSELRNLSLPQRAFSDPTGANVKHTLKRVAPDVIEQKTEVVDQVYSAVVKYAFGSGDRGLTLVGRGEKGQAFELRLSRYRHGTDYGWDITSGHLLRPDEPIRFLGEPLTEDSVRRCLSCHVTSAQAITTASGPVASDHGISCEQCHGPGENHILAVKADLPDRAIIDPRLASGAEVVALCARCHSPRGGSVARDDPAAARFQGASLTWSRCFLESQDALSCITCHDPHRDAVKSPAHYEAKCLSCHSGTSQSGRKQSRSGLESLSHAPPPSVCPVKPTEGCIGCHMPSVENVVPHSSFTDHFIRVHRD
jgi:tetratricopeptide (TPR) repeat protein